MQENGNWQCFPELTEVIRLNNSLRFSSPRCTFAGLLASGCELVWVMRQVVWAFILGLFYRYMVVRMRNLLPLMIVNYPGNVFIGLLTGYLQSRVSIEMHALFGVIFPLGMVPTHLMILRTRFFVSRWLPND